METLSDKIFPTMLITPMGKNPMAKGILKSDVKKFIEKLKFEMELTYENCKIIDRLAGEKLIIITKEVKQSK